MTENYLSPISFLIKRCIVPHKVFSLLIYFSLLLNAQSLSHWGYFPGAEDGAVVLAPSNISMSNFRFADWDGDGKTDIITKFSGKVQFSSAGEKSWATMTGTNVALSDLRFGDFNGDGRADIFTKFGQNWNIVYHGSGRGWQDLGRDGKNIALSNLRFGDFNGDGQLDVFGKSGNQWLVSYSAKSSWQNLAQSNVALRDLRFGDFDGDGKTDVFTKFNNQWAFSSGGSGSWQNLAQSNIPLGSHHFGDFDGDNVTDVLTRFDEFWYLSSGARESWRKLRRADGSPETPFYNGGGKTYAIGDFDNDGRDDILTKARFDNSFTRVSPNRNRNVRFLATADPQFDINKKNGSKWKDATATLNQLAGLLSTNTYRGLVVAGDITQNTRVDELAAFQTPLRGVESKVYPGLGNHDLESANSRLLLNFAAQLLRRYQDQGIALDGIRTPFSSNEPRFKWNWDLDIFSNHSQFPNYSWNWDDVHFVQLNLYPGDDKSPTSTKDTPKNTLTPHYSLSYLKDDLALHVGNSRKPVILIHHYGFDAFSRSNEFPSSNSGLTNTNADGSDTWWNSEKRNRYWEAIKDYNVIAIFTGHIHTPRAVSNPPGPLQWHTVWTRPVGASGGPNSIDTFVSGGANFGYFLDVTINGNRITVQPNPNLSQPNTAHPDAANPFSKTF